MSLEVIENQWKGAEGLLQGMITNKKGQVKAIHRGFL
jgi:hypothetical protein